VTAGIQTLPVSDAAEQDGWLAPGSVHTPWLSAGGSAATAGSVGPAGCNGEGCRRQVHVAAAVAADPTSKGP